MAGKPEELQCLSAEVAEEGREHRRIAQKRATDSSFNKEFKKSNCSIDDEFNEDSGDQFLEETHC